MFSSLSSQLRTQLIKANPFSSLLGNNLKNRNMNSLLNKLPKKKFSNVYVNHRDTVDNNQNTPFDFTEENYKKVEEIMV